MAAPDLISFGRASYMPHELETTARQVRENPKFASRANRGLLHVGQPAQDHLAATLDQAEDGWLDLRQRAAARRACQPAPAPEPASLATAAGCPLCPATT